MSREQLSSPTALSSKMRKHLGEMTKILIFTILLFTTLHFTIQNFYIQGESMEPSLHNREYILVNKTAYLIQQPERGDVIVFHYPLNPRMNFVKRIIAMPGDTLSIIGQKVIVNSVVLNEPYINLQDKNSEFASFQNMHLGTNQYFVMGDNRGNSSDSREWGFVPEQNIIGKATIVLWPLNEGNTGLLPNVSQVFAQVR